MRTEQTSAHLVQVEKQPREEFKRFLDTNYPNVEFGQSKQFYILVLGQYNIRLLCGTRSTIEVVEVEGAPQEMCKALGEQCSDVETQTSAPSNWQRNLVLRYSRMVNWAVHRFLVGNQAPLIVAGPEFQRRIYHKVNTYPHLLDQDIVRNVDHLADEDLQRLAWVVVKPLFRQTHEQTLEHFLQQLASGKPSVQPKLKVLHDGWIAPAVITEETRPIRVVYSKSARLQESNEQYCMNADLISNLPAQAILNGGSLYVLPSPVLTVPIVPAVPAAS